MHLHWNKINNKKGLPLANLLALSPTTSLISTAKLIFGGNTNPATRISALSGLNLATFPWLAGILLFGP